jgi:RimJ/RimL family protein N-acetyltransferase
VDYPQSVETERLTLTPASVGDADALFPILSDPAGWWYDPAGRHADPDRTRRFLARAAERWAEGLSYWTARERVASRPPDAGPAPPPTGRVIGIGGVQRHASGAWNLSYRIATDAQGRGFATELARAAQAAAAHVDPTVPLIAWVAAHNIPSRRVAERLGLTDQGPYPDANDGVTRLAYADRPIDRFLRR